MPRNADGINVHFGIVLNGVMGSSDVTASPIEGLSAEMTDKRDDVLGTTMAWREAGHPVALATVVETWGSSPRPVGSQLAVNCQSLEMVGSVSGGCVEAAVIDVAKDVVSSGKSQLQTFSVSSDLAWEFGLTCGGMLKVFIEPVE